MTNEKKKLQIVFIHPDLGIGGAERLILDIANSLQENYKILFLTNHFDKKHCFDELKQSKYEIKTIGDWIPRSLFGKCQALCAYIRLMYLTLVYLLFLKNDEASVFITDLIPIANPFLKLSNQKVIYYCHHPDLLASSRNTSIKKFYRKPLDWMEMKATWYSDIILVNSKYTATVFKNTFPDIEIPMRVVYPTVANTFEDCLKNLGNEKLEIEAVVPNIPPDSFVFLSINRFHPAKKLELAINALKIFKEKKLEIFNKIYLVMAGGYDPISEINATYFERLNTLTNQYNLSNKVIFIKSPTDYEKARLLKSCSCLIYTPVKEHFGIVPLEAMLVSKPVLACKSGGPCETVDHGITGYLSEPNPVDMAKFMCKIASADNLDDMGYKGKIRLDEKFSNRKFTLDVNEIVENIIKTN